MDLDMNGTHDGGEDTEQLSMEQLMEMEDAVQSLKVGEIVSGTVVAVSNDEVMIDIGYKCEGMLPVAEVTNAETGELTVAIGDPIDVYVGRIDATEGRVNLSYEKAARLRIWTDLEKAFKAEELVTGKVLERVKGGLAVDIGIRAFLPGSLVDIRPNRRLEDFIDQDIEARIISFDRRRSNVVLSRKALLEEEVESVKQETMANLEEGQLVSGAIKNITDYGVFIDLGGLDGLLHITDISWGRVAHPSEYFKVGDEVEVVVLRFDKERERVSLGYKQRFEDPWLLVPEKYLIGKRVHGSVVSIVDYGAFIALEEGVEGLVHVSEMSWTKKIKNPRSVMEIGQEVDVVVSEVDLDKRRLSLSLRATETNPWETVAESYHVGSRVKGTVRNLTEFGAFVEIVPGVDGLVHISDMSWTRRISHPSEVVQKGQEVNAVVTALDPVKQRISLSMKELMPNEWEEYANKHGVGNLVAGSVTNVTDFGVFIELAPGVEGLCHISEIDRPGGEALEEIFTAGQKLRCRILRIDWNESRIGLSINGVTQDEDGGALEVEGENAAMETAMSAALKAGGIVVEAEAADESPVEDAVTEPAEEIVEPVKTDAEEMPVEAGPEEEAAETTDVVESAPEEPVVEESTAEEVTAEELVEEAVAEKAVKKTAKKAVKKTAKKPAKKPAKKTTKKSEEV